MPKFRLAWSETYLFEKTVEAESLDAAMEQFKSGDFEFPESMENARYDPDSAELDVGYTQWLNTAGRPGWENL